MKLTPKQATFMIVSYLDEKNKDQHFNYKIHGGKGSDSILKRAKEKRVNLKKHDTSEIDKFSKMHFERLKREGKNYGRS